MSNTVPCTGNCGVSNHVAGSASHKTCQARTSAMASHPAGKGRGTSESVASDFSDSPAEEGRRQAEKHLDRLDEVVTVSDHYRDADDIRSDIRDIDSEIENLVTPGEYDQYESYHATSQRGARISILNNRRSSLVTALAEQSILVDRLGTEGFAQAREIDHNKRKVFILRDAVDTPPSDATEKARVQVLTEEFDALTDQIDDYQADHGDPWQEMRREWSKKTMGVTGADYIEAEQVRLREALTKTGDENLLRG